MSQTLLLRLLEYQANVKLFHFQTKQYGRHKAADDLYHRLTQLIDDYFEAYQGQTRRLPPLQGVLRVGTISDSNFAAYTQRFMVLLERTTRSRCQRRSNSDLCNILDEIRAALAQFIYLLSFR